MIIYSSIKQNIPPLAPNNMAPFALLSLICKPVKMSMEEKPLDYNMVGAPTTKKVDLLQE